MSLWEKVWEKTQELAALFPGGARVFVLADKELENYKAWLASHECDFWDRNKPKLNEHGFPRGGAIGGVFSYQFTSTGLGDVVIVKCACGHEENVTDFDSW